MRRSIGLRGNPIFGHELRRFWRAGRRLGRRPATRVAIALLVVGSYLLVVLAWSLLLERESLGRAVLIADLFMAVLIACLLAPGLTAATLVAERQRGTWEMLVVTPLKPRQLILGKLAAQLISIVTLAAAVLPFGLAPLLHAEVDLAAVAATLIVGPVSVLGLAVLGLLASARCRTVAAATATAYALCLALLLVVPIAETLLGELVSYSFEPVLTPITSPPMTWAMIYTLLDGGQIGESQTTALLGPLLYAAIAYYGLRLLLSRFGDWLVAPPLRAG